MSKPDRKPRSDSKLGSLPREIQERIADWCAQDSLDFAVQHCASELSPPVVVSLDTMSRWYRRWKSEQATAERKATISELFEHADANAKAVGELLRTTGATEDQIARANQLVFTLQASSDENREMFIELEKLRLARETAAHKARMDEAKLKQKDKDLGLAERRVTLLEAKLAEMKSTATDTTLTDEERAKRIAEIYGRA